MKMNLIYSGDFRKFDGLMGSQLIHETFPAEDAGEWDCYFSETYRSRKGYLYEYSWRVAEGAEGRLDEMLRVYKPVRLKERMCHARRMQKQRRKAGEPARS